MAAATITSSEAVDSFDLNSDSTWEKLYPVLESFARFIVYSSNMPSWKGQEDDVIKDIVQETGRRIIEHSQKAKRGEALPIRSLKNMLFAVAHNYCEDLRRRDRRLVRIQLDAPPCQPCLDQRDRVNLMEISAENVYQEALFKLVAREVAVFPDKQRRAILIDLASRMHFDTQPTPLQKAFLDAGIDLRGYKQPLPLSPQEKSKQNSLASCAYKRVASLWLVHKYIALS